MTKYNGIPKKNFTVLIFLILLSLLLLFLFKIAFVPKTPATVERVMEVLVSEGYNPQDTTELYLNKYPKTDPFESIGVEKDDIRFEFFTFENENSARSAYVKFYSLVFSTRDIPYSQHHTHLSNYDIYTLISNGTCSIAMRVGTTVVYSYCNEENEGKIAKILQNIDYFKKSSNEDTNENTTEKGQTNIPEKALIRIVYLFLLFPVTWLSLRWLWSAICKAAGATKQEVKIYRKTNRKWLINDSKNPKKVRRLFTIYNLCVVPNLICLIFAVISCFTHIFDKVIDNTIIAISGLPFVFGLADILYSRFKKE